ncbi:MAG: hypothetical protein ABR562_02280 [Thermoplasmatota archaeon]|nr:hypothetical protein [Halobacteriales archaeon]
MTVYNPTREEGHLSTFLAEDTWKADTTDSLTLTASHAYGDFFTSKLAAHDSTWMVVEFHTLNDAHLKTVAYDSYSGYAKAKVPDY